MSGYWVRIGQNWLPTAENVNALPAPLFNYIHDIETRCDPAGEKRELALLRDEVRMLQSAFHVLRREA